MSNSSDKNTSPEAPSDQAASHPAPAGFDSSRGWQPIATAPKDNEDSILVCDARVIGGFHQVVWWSEGPKAAGYNWYTSDGPNFHRDAFTHWMPLPPEPALGIEARQGRDEGSACESPAPSGATPHPQSPSLSEVEETKAVPGWQPPNVAEQRFAAEEASHD